MGLFVKQFSAFLMGLHQLKMVSLVPDDSLPRLSRAKSFFIITCATFFIQESAASSNPSVAKKIVEVSFGQLVLEHSLEIVDRLRVRQMSQI